MSGYILAADSPDDVRRFAAEVGPAVRERVETERSRPDRARETTVANERVAVGPPAATPLEVTATPDDGTRRSDEQLWDVATRPTGPRPGPGREFTADQQAGQHLVGVHDGLRAELDRLRHLVEQVAAGSVAPGGPFADQHHDDPAEQLDARRLLRVLLPHGHRSPHPRGPQHLPAPPSPTRDWRRSSPGSKRSIT